MSPRQGALGTSTSIEVYAPRGNAGTLALREPHRHTTRRGSVFGEEDTAEEEERAAAGDEGTSGGPKA